MKNDRFLELERFIDLYPNTVITALKHELDFFKLLDKHLPNPIPWRIADEKKDAD